MKPNEGVELYAAWLIARHYKPQTIETRRRYLVRFGEWLEVQGIDDLRDVVLQHLLDYQIQIRQRRKPNGELACVANQNQQVWLVTALFKFLHQRGKLLVDPSRHLPELKGSRQLTRRVLSGEQVNRLVAAANTKKLWGFRDRTMLELLYSSGLRGGEICRLTLHDLDWQEKTVRIIQGKGRKDRIVPMGSVAMAYLREYIDRVRPALLGKYKYKAGYTPKERAVSQLFFSQVRGTLQTHTLLRVVRRCAKIAGIAEKQTNTHGLRHACATEMLKGGASVRHVQEMLGHASLATTQRYTQVKPYDLKKVHAQTAPSERRRKMEVPAFIQKSWQDNRKNPAPW